MTEDKLLEKFEVFAWATHHEPPMLFPTYTEAAQHCDTDEEPIRLFALKDIDD